MIGWAGDALPGRPWWWDEAGTPPAVSDELPDRVDLLVIGAGYTGLSAARTAHDGGATVAVVDAGVPGQGASTRNGGMFGAHPRLTREALAGRFGGEVADAVLAEAAEALRWARALVAEEGIDCALQPVGRLLLAWTPGHFEALQRLAETIRARSPVRVDVIPRQRLGAHVATARYHGGLIFPEHCGINPARLHAGLIAALRRRGVPVRGNAPVVDLRRGRGCHVAHIGDGRQITAERVILATNGYTSGPFRWHRARVFPLPSYIIATEPLPESLLAELAPGRHMMVETRARHSYFRLSPDGRRILFGGRAAMVPIDPLRAAARLHATMCEIWPQLRDVRVTHAWSGLTGYSFNHTPHVGSHDGIHHAMGYSGSGTVMAPWLGAKAAWQALGDPRGATAYAHTPFRRHPLHPLGRPWFLHAANLWYRQVVDRLEAAAARRGAGR